MKFALFLICGVSSLMLSSCGSIQKVDTASKTVPNRVYNRVVVKDFTHTITDDDGTTPVAARKFSDYISRAI
jgi:uncharacterized protein YceK